MATKIKWGIIGLGKIAHTFAEDLLRSSDSELVAVASRSAEKAQLFAKKFGAQRHYASYSEFIENAAVNVVYIATPHPFHVPLSKACLLNGKAVLCEKPLGMNADEVAALIALAHQQKLFLMEGIWTRFMPTTLKVLELLQDGVLGELLSLQADFGFKAKYDVNARLFNKSLGGGSLLDIGIYPLFLSLLALGKASEIEAEAEMAPTGVDKSCKISLRYPHGAKAFLQCSFVENTPTEALISGTKGSLKMHQRFHHSQSLSLKLKTGETREYHIPYTGNGYVHEIREVNQCLQLGQLQSEKLPHSFSLELSQLLDAVREKINLTY